MSDFMIYLEDIGVIQSTEWAFDNLSDGELNTLLNTHMVEVSHPQPGSYSPTMKSAITEIAASNK